MDDFVYTWYIYGLKYLGIYYKWTITINYYKSKMIISVSTIIDCNFDAYKNYRKLFLIYYNICVLRIL